MQLLKIYPVLLSLITTAIARPQASNTVSTSSSATTTTSSTSTAEKSINNTVNVIPLPSIAVQPLPFISRNYSQPYVPETFLDQFKSQENVSSQPHFQVFEEDLAKAILGDEPELRLLVNEPGYAFAHEAPIYFKDGTLTFCSYAGSVEGRSNATTNNKVFGMNLTQVLDKLSSGKTATFAEDVKELNINSTGVQMTNGGTNFRGDLLLANSGRTEAYPGGLAIVNKQDPSNVTVLVNQAFGKQFNSPNDVVVHPTSGAIFFTDAFYGFTQNFRPPLGIPQMTWRFDPISSRLTALDDSISTPNGLVLSPDGKQLFITETGSTPDGPHPPIPSKPSSIYVFDVNETADKKNQYLSNRRLFAWADTGIADGIKVDTKGNVYTGSADGITVYAPSGIVILKMFLPDGAVNLRFAEPGQLVITAEDKLWLAMLSNDVEGPDLESLPK